ncbi:MAG: hypothetical protein KUL87_14645 [Pseudomonas sp.]|nr:hypothetical protein [Pseudomonas sp.]
MEKYLIVSPATLPAGTRLGLTKPQAEARQHALQPAGKGRYVAILPVQFKVGETISVDGELPKALAENLSQPTAVAAEEAAQAPAADTPQE